MIRLSLRHLKPGMVLALPLHGPDGRVLLNAGVALKPAYIQRLLDQGFTGVYVRDGVADDIPPATPIGDETRLRAVATVRQAFADLERDGAAAGLGAVRQAVHAILDDLLVNPAVDITLGQVRSADDYTFAHSVDVGVMALIVGMALGYPQPRLHELGVGALLHDVGKVRVVPRQLLTKPGPLTPEETEEMQRHTLYGFDLLRGRPDVSAISAHVAYQHHERCDGSGYPRSLREPEIHPVAQVVAVVDVFDAMTADRPYRPGMAPHEAAIELHRMKERQLNPRMVEAFLSRLALFPVGTTVRLNTGELAVVVSQEPANRTRPTVRIMSDERGQPRPQPVTVQLLNDRARRIVGPAHPEDCAPFASHAVS